MDDGGRCQLVDVINDPQLLESFLENGAANKNSNHKNHQSTGNQTQSTHKVTKKSAKPHSRVSNSPAGGRNSKRKLEARQVDTVTSSDSGPLVAEPVEEKKNSKSGGKARSAVPTPSPQTLSLHVPNSQAASGVMLPQQLLQMTPGAQLPQVVSGLGGQMILTRPQNQQGAGPLVQIIQTSNGPTAQLIPVSVQSSPSSGKSGSGQSTRAGNKQILPKPSSSPVSAPVSSLTVAGGAQNPVIRPALSVAGTPHAVTLTQNSVNSAAPQLILSGGQTPSLIQGPNGTFILNSGALSGMGGQQLIFQNNGLGGMGSPFQLTIRAPSPQVIVSSSPSFQTSTPLLNALSQSGRTMPTQQTFVLQQNPAQAQTLFSPRTSHNMVWTRNTAPVISNPTIIQSPAAQPQQYISIQTANGPVLLPLAQTQSGPQIVPQSSQPISIPSNNGLVQNFGGQFSGTTLQSLLTANAPANDLSHVTTSSAGHSVIFTAPTVQTTSSGSKSSSSKKNTSSKGVNLADLLKESGILENSPPTSPNDVKQSNSSPDFTEPLIQQQPPPQQTVFMVPTGANQTPHNLVLTAQSGLQAPGLNQLRLALTADGSMILQPSGPNVPAFSCVQQPVPVTEEAAGCRKVSDTAKDQVLGASQPSPDSTTPTLDATPQSASTADQTSGAGSDGKSNEKLDAECKASIPMTVTDINSTNESQKAKCVREEANRGNEIPANASSPATAVIRSANCDNQSSKLPVFMSSDPASKKTDGGVAPTTGPVMQISLDDKAFMEGLEAQIKGLASISSATEQQKSQLRELQNLQNQISEAKKNQNPCENVKVLLGVPAVRVAGQEQQHQHVYQTTHVVQTNTQSGQQSQQPPNVHLVNLLKPQTGIGVSPGAPAAIRLMSPSVVTAVSEAPAFQLMGNQLITITSPAKTQMQSIQTPAASPTKMSLSNTPVIQVVRLQTTQANAVTPAPIRPAPGKAGDPALDQEKRKQKTLKFFNQQLAADQTAALRPDYKTPFRSLDDACKRLLRYHVLSTTTCSASVLGKRAVDEDFETISRDLLIKKQLLVDRFRRCILRQSYQTEVSETVMLNKMFIADETSAIKFDKEVVAQGIPLDLPPPPRSWQHEIAARVHDEEREMSRKRKLPFLDEDLSEHLSEVKKQPIEPPVDKESDDGTEDEDDDSDDDDDDDANPGDDMSEYLGPNDNGNVDINSIYDEINYDPSLTSSDTPQGVELDFCERSDNLSFQVQPSSQSDWRVGYDRNHWTPSTRFPEREAAVAVESILTSDEEDEDDDESGMSAMNALARQDDNEHDEEEDEDEEDDDEEDDEGEDEEEEEENSAVGSHPYPDFTETGLQEQQPVDSCDPQIQCAIDSILVDLPQQPSHQPFFHADSYGRPYAAMSGGMSVGHRTGLTSFGHSMQINDPALDEAVKSILS